MNPGAANAMTLLLAAGIGFAGCTTDPNLRQTEIPLLDPPSYDYLKTQSRCGNKQMALKIDCPPWQICAVEEKNPLWCTP